MIGKTIKVNYLIYLLKITEIVLDYDVRIGD
jgi:hypothetical protein